MNLNVTIRITKPMKEKFNKDFNNFVFDLAMAFIFFLIIVVMAHIC